MFTTFLTGLMLGLGNSGICLGTCAPVALSVVFDQAPQRGWPAIRALLLFLVGRAGGYLALGLVAGAVAAQQYAGMQRPLALAFVALAVALWLGAAGRSAPEGSWACRFAHGPGRLARWPLLLGALTGLQLCPPLLLVFSSAVEAGGFASAIAEFAGFFLGSSAGLAPLALWPWIGRRFGPASLARLRVSAALVVGFFFFCWGMDRLFPPKVLDLNVDEVALREVMPNAKVFKPRLSDDPPRFEAFESESGAGVPSGICFVTSHVVPAHTMGYGGPVSALVGLNMAGEITGVKLLPHQETPLYVERVQDLSYLAKYKGRRITQALRLGEDVDAITGATVTADAVCSGIREAGREIGRKCLGIIPEESAGPSWRAAATQWQVLLLFGYLAAAVAVARLWAERRRVRDGVMIASIAVLGLIEMQFFSIGHVLQVGARQWPSLPANLNWYVLVCGAILITVLWSRLYCNCLCPFGALTEFLSRLWPVPVPLSPRVSRALRPLRFVLLVVTPGAFFVWRRHEVIEYEPFSPTFSGLSGRGLPWDVLMLGSLALVGILCLSNRRFWCRHLCPAGAALETVAMLKPGAPAGADGPSGVEGSP